MSTTKTKTLTAVIDDTTTGVSKQARQVTLRRNREWTGAVVRRAGDMTLVAWLTGALAGESKWTDTSSLELTGATR